MRLKLIQFTLLVSALLERKFSPQNVLDKYFSSGILMGEHEDAGGSDTFRDKIGENTGRK